LSSNYARLNKTIEIYCDGGCRGNGKNNNVGAWAYIVLVDNVISKEKVEIVCNTTSNRMEINACIEALDSFTIYDKPVLVTSDSQYLINGITHKWISNNWITMENKSVKNMDLWKRLLELKNKFSNIQFEWCRGHNDNIYNIKVDDMVNKAMDNIINNTTHDYDDYKYRMEVIKYENRK
jgi:ribonuclease HI